MDDIEEDKLLPLMIIINTEFRQRRTLFLLRILWQIVPCWRRLVHYKLPAASALLGAMVVSLFLFSVGEQDCVFYTDSTPKVGGLSDIQGDL